MKTGTQLLPINSKEASGKIFDTANTKIGVKANNSYQKNEEISKQKITWKLYGTIFTMCSCTFTLF
jgi:hypothetical protein